MEERALMTVDVPFAFTVENTRLPAGHYVIYAVHLNHLWEVSSFRHGGTAFFHVSPTETRTPAALPKLIFHRYESDYVLHEIDESSLQMKATLSEGKREKQLARDNPQPQIAMIDAEPGERRE